MSQNITININDSKIVLPKSFLVGIPFFDAKFVRWNKDEEITIKSPDYEDTSEKSTNMIIQTLFSSMTIVQFDNLDTCYDYIKYGCFLTVDTHMQKCLTYLKSIIKRHNVLEIYLKIRDYVTDKIFLDHCKHLIGNMVQTIYKQIIESDLDLFLELASQEYSYFETQFQKYTFVKTLHLEMCPDLDLWSEGVPIEGTDSKELTPIPVRKCMEAWVSSVNYVQLGPEELNTVIQDKFVPDRILKGHLEQVDKIWKLIENKQPVSTQFYLNATIRLIKVDDKIVIKELTSGDDGSTTEITKIKTFPRIRFFGNDWCIELKRETQSQPNISPAPPPMNDFSIFVYRFVMDDHKEHYKNKIGVNYTIKIGDSYKNDTTSNAFIENSQGWGWGWKYMLCLNNMFENGEYVEEKVRDVRLSVIVNSFNGEVVETK